MLVEILPSPISFVPLGTKCGFTLRTIIFYRREFALSASSVFKKGHPQGLPLRMRSRGRSVINSLWSLTAGCEGETRSNPVSSGCKPDNQ